MDNIPSYVYATLCFPICQWGKRVSETFWLLGIMLRTQVYKYLFELRNIFKEHFSPHEKYLSNLVILIWL